MKIALFSDIHANLPALEAVLEDLQKRRPDSVFCLGDLVGYNVWPNEVIRVIRSRGIPTIAGNYDFGVGRNSDDCGCAYKTAEEKAMGAVSISLTNQWIGEEEREYLRTLPLHIRLDFQMKDEKLGLLLVHGSPRKINEYLFEDRDEKSLIRIMQEAQADILCFGHTHKPWHRTFALEGSGKQLHAINIGSVGKPKDGDPSACYCLLEIDESSTVRVEMIRVAYDVEKAAKAIGESDLPRGYADMLRKAI